ncbi:MAG: leucine-rich repeat domain-containing protein, partial [Ruminococcus sp.]|nr:leucine-rich repeat domain-containing protein [Ruminococcus sp.]
YKHNWSSVKIPDGVTKIGEEAFRYNCLMSVIIPDSVTEIGKKSFCSCEKLSSITIPNSVIKIGEQAFYGCENLTSVTIPNNVTEIGDGAFEWCHNLTSVNIPRRFENDEKRIFSLSPKVVISYTEPEAEVKHEEKKPERIDEKFKKFIKKLWS